MKKKLIEHLLELDSLASLSKQAEACPLQDPFRIRARYLGWKTASLLLDEKGDLKKDVLREFASAFEEGICPVGRHESDALIFRHLRLCLNELEKNDALQKALKKCSLPLCNKQAEEIIRDSLWPQKIKLITNAHIRRAVLGAWFTLLRQATGSCFATAPAILIQSQEPLMLIRDLDALLSAGELRRGSYAVPLHPGSGPGDLQKWIRGAPEFSPGLKAAFHAANTPFPSAIPNGISVERMLKEKLLEYYGLTEEDLAKEANSLLPQFGVFWERMGGHYIGASSKTKQVQNWEKVFANASRAFLAVADCALLRAWEYTLASFSDVKIEFARWNLFVSLGLSHEASPPGIGACLLQATQKKLDAANSRITEAGREYQRAVQTAKATERLLQRALSDGERGKLNGELLAELHVIESLSSKIEEEQRLARWLSQFYSKFIKETAEKLQLAFQEVFDPAIGDASEERLEDSIAGFRLLYKSGRSAAASWERIEDEKGFILAACKFFESIENDLAIDPPMQSCFTLIITELLQYIRSDEFLSGALVRAKKNKSAKNAAPWAYESGGTMQTLLQTYYDPPPRTEEFSRSIRSPLELLPFLKEAAAKATKERHLMLSPTHAFLFCPHLFNLNDELEVFRPQEHSIGQAEFLIDRLAATIPSDVRPVFYFGCRGHGGGDTLLALRSQLLAGWSSARLSHNEHVDAFLYEALPLFTFEEAGGLFERIRLRLGIKNPISYPQKEFFLSQDILQILKKALIQDKGAFSSVDWDFELAHAARMEGVVASRPILFADTNWSDWFFGLIRNNATSEIELWRFNRTGLRGFPMNEWNPIFQEGGNWSILL